jgi:EAL domain-containing protein (putative c-di-GMP-specific phosphodiesterase class I)
VEDEETVELLQSWGCGFVQGHFFSPPVAASVIRTGPWGSATTDSRVTSPAATPPSWA